MISKWSIVCSKVALTQIVHEKIIKDFDNHYKTSSRYEEFELRYFKTHIKEIDTLIHNKLENYTENYEFSSYISKTTLLPWTLLPL